MDKLFNNLKSSQSNQPNPNPDHDRTGQLAVCRDASHAQGHEQLNEVDIDFRIPGLPHSVVKHAENSRVRELVKKIENHPHRQSLQRDLQQNKAYNPFSTTSKKMIQDVGNVELFELFETCIKRDFTRKHDRFLRDHVFRERMLEHNRDDDVCREWDALADQDHTCRMSES